MTTVTITTVVMHVVRRLSGSGLDASPPRKKNMNTLLTRSNSAKARLAAVKRNGGILAVLRSPAGAIDLASIMVGVLVIGIIGGVIAATVFAVIPWSQDEAAKGALDSVKTAESVQFAFSTGDGAGEYLDVAGLVSGELLQSTTKVVILTDGDSYTAVTRSDSGAYFSIASANPTEITKYADLDALNVALVATGVFDWTANVLGFTTI